MAENICETNKEKKNFPVLILTEKIFNPIFDFLLNSIGFGFICCCCLPSNNLSGSMIDHWNSFFSPSSSNYLPNRELKIFF